MLLHIITITITVHRTYVRATHAHLRGHTHSHRDTTTTDERTIFARSVRAQKRLPPTARSTALNSLRPTHHHRDPHRQRRLSTRCAVYFFPIEKSHHAAVRPPSRFSLIRRRRCRHRHRHRHTVRVPWSGFVLIVIIIYLLQFFFF